MFAHDPQTICFAENCMDRGQGQAPPFFFRLVGEVGCNLHHSPPRRISGLHKMYPSATMSAFVMIEKRARTTTRKLLFSLLSRGLFLLRLPRSFS